MRKGLAVTLGMISVFGLAVACQQGKSRAMKPMAHAAAQNPDPQFDQSQMQTRGTQNGTQSGIQSGAAVSSGTAQASGNLSASGTADSGVVGSSVLTRTSIVTLKCIDNGSSQCDIMKMMEMQREAHIIFNQAWKAIFKTTNDSSVAEVGSIFKTTSNQMKQLYRADGAKVTAAQTCSQTRPMLEDLSTPAQKRYVLSIVDCQNQARRKELVTFSKDNKNQWTLTYATASMPKESIGASLQFLAKPVICKITMNENIKISHLSCEGLGQSTPASVATSHDDYTEFRTFIFSLADQTEILQVTGTKNHGIQDRQPQTFSMMVPVEGAILYSEKVVIQENITEQPTAAGPAPSVAAPGTEASQVNEQQVQGKTQVIGTASAAGASVTATEHVKNHVGAQSQDDSAEKEKAVLLSVLIEEDRRIFDLAKPEEQQQMLQYLREEKAAADAAKAQLTGQEAGQNSMSGEQNANLAADPIYDNAAPAASESPDLGSSIR